MLIISKILTGAAGLAMVAGASAPAFAHSNPYNGYGNSNGNVVGQVLNQVLGGGAYGQYGQGNDRIAVDQCAHAAQARVSQAGYGRYNQGYNGQGYGNNGYNSAASARVVGITSVERKSNGLKVSGVMSLCSEAKTAPATPAVMPLNTKTVRLALQTGTPTACAVTGLSLIATRPRPHLRRATFQVNQVTRTASVSAR